MSQYLILLVTLPEINVYKMVINPQKFQKYARPALPLAVVVGLSSCVCRCTDLMLMSSETGTVPHALASGDVNGLCEIELRVKRAG